jgi:hypothetical protein
MLKNKKGDPAGRLFFVKLSLTSRIFLTIGIAPIAYAIRFLFHGSCALHKADRQSELFHRYLSKQHIDALS